MPLREGKKKLSRASLNPEELDTGLLNPSHSAFHSLPQSSLAQESPGLEQVALHWLDSSLQVVGWGHGHLQRTEVSPAPNLDARRSLDASAHFVNFGVIFKKHFVFLYV